MALTNASRMMEFDYPEYRPDSPASHVSLLNEDEISSPSAAVQMKRHDSVQQMPPWLRKEVADRRRQRVASQQLDTLSKLTEDHFSIPTGDRYDIQHTLVADWLDGLPERLIEGWETVLKEEVEETFIKRSSNTSSVRRSRSRLEGEEMNGGYQDDEISIIGDACADDDDLGDPKTDQDIEDDFLHKVLLGRKRLMQAEISVKRLKMGLKYVANGMDEEFGDAQRTRNLLAAVNSTFEEVVRKRLSTATVKGVDHEKDYQGRLADLRERDPTLMSRIYLEKEIRELKTMVEDILSMDGRRVDGEGKQWFLMNLSRLMELREDMALAEKEIERGKMLRGKQLSSEGSHYEESRTNTHETRSENCVAVSLWDLYYMQYCWIQAVFEYRPIQPWEGFEISLEDEVESEDWQLRIEQRVWLQEQFGLTVGATPWTPFRQGNSAFYI